MNQEYTDFLSSENWKQKRKELISERGQECERCHKPVTKNELHLHHLSYDQEFGTEKDEELMLVCNECHKEFHQDVNFFKNKNNQIVPQNRSPYVKEVFNKSITSLQLSSNSENACPECQKPMIKIKTGWICGKCGIQVEVTDK